MIEIHIRIGGGGPAYGGFGACSITPRAQCLSSATDPRADVAVSSKRLTRGGRRSGRLTGTAGGVPCGAEDDSRRTDPAVAVRRLEGVQTRGHSYDDVISVK